MKGFRTVIPLVILSMMMPIWSGCRGGTDRSTSAAATKTSKSQLNKIVLHSQALKKDMKINIYLPADYSTSERYPVLYMLHGYSGNEDNWMPDLRLDKTADRLIDEQRIKPVLLVAPQIDNSYGFNSTGVPWKEGESPRPDMSDGMYEDYLFKEVIPYIDSHYSTIAAKEGRTIGGLSMGGCAALHLAFAHPDLFCKVGGHSPALFLNQSRSDIEKWLYPNKELQAERDPLILARDKDLGDLNVYLDCGDQDSYRFYEGCDKLFAILQAMGVDVQYHLNPGGHEGSYWEANEEKYLLFYAGIQH